MEISVVFATYKRDSILRKTLTAFQNLQTDGLEWEIIVVDNGCSQSTESLVAEFSPRLPIFYYEESKPGKNNAINLGVSKASSALIALTDDDVLPDPHWLKELISGSKKWPEFSMFGGKILPAFPESSPIDSRIPLGHIFAKTALVIADWDQSEGLIPYGRIWGPNMLVRRQVIDSGISFDASIGPTPQKNYVMGSETDFLKRADAAGFKSGYLPCAIVHHQIRPEQTSLKWFSERAYRSGRGTVQLNLQAHDSFKKWFGVPRFLYRKVIENFLLSHIFKILGKNEKYFDTFMTFHISLGQISRYREINKKL